MGRHKRVDRQARQSRPRRRNLGSSLAFGALAVVLIAIAAYTYTQDEEDEPVTAPPPNPITAGRIEVINVRDALGAQELEAEMLPRTARATDRATDLSPPGQLISLGAASVYVFVYPNVAAREAESTGMDPNSLTLTSIGTPIAGGADPPHVITRGNIIVVLVGGDAELQEQVDAAIRSLPEATPEAAVQPGSRLAA